MFKITLINVIMTLIYIAPGYILGKMKKALPEHLSTLSAVLIYVGTPCLIISSFIKIEFDKVMVLNLVLFFFITIVLQLAFLGILYFILHKKYDNPKYKVLSLGAICGNVGFFGLPVIRAIFPNNPEVMVYSCVYVVTMNIIVFSIGVFLLTGDKKYVSLKAAFLNTSFIPFLMGIGLFVLGVGKYFPEPLVNGLDIVSRMTAPLCMIILGVRLSAIKFTSLFTNVSVYITLIIKLLIFPLFCYFVVYFLPLDSVLKASVLILSGTPCASIMFNFAEMYKSNREQSANCVLLSTLLCFITIPLLTLFL